MKLNIHSDASYLLVKNARSQAAGHFFLVKTPVDGEPIWLNGAIRTYCVILKFIAASAAEGELGASFLNAKVGTIIKVNSYRRGDIICTLVQKHICPYF